MLRLRLVKQYSGRVFVLHVANQGLISIPPIWAPKLSEVALNTDTGVSPAGCDPQTNKQMKV